MSLEKLKLDSYKREKGSAIEGKIFELKHDGIKVRLKEAYSPEFWKTYIDEIGADDNVSKEKDELGTAKAYAAITEEIIQGDVSITDKDAIEEIFTDKSYWPLAQEIRILANNTANFTIKGRKK